jgi:hypothetical protein
VKKPWALHDIIINVSTYSYIFWRQDGACGPRAFGATGGKSAPSQAQRNVTATTMEKRVEIVTHNFLHSFIPVSLLAWSRLQSRVQAAQRTATRGRLHYSRENRQAGKSIESFMHISLNKDCSRRFRSLVTGLGAVMSGAPVDTNCNEQLLLRFTTMAGIQLHIVRGVWRCMLDCRCRCTRSIRKLRRSACKNCTRVATCTNYVQQLRSDLLRKVGSFYGSRRRLCECSERGTEGEWLLPPPPRPGPCMAVNPLLLYLHHAVSSSYMFFSDDPYCPKSLGRPVSVDPSAPAACRALSGA